MMQHDDMTRSLNPEREPDEHALDRFLAGHSPDAERDLIERWLAAHPEARVRLSALQATTVSRADTVAELDHRLGQFWARVAQDQETNGASANAPHHTGTPAPARTATVQRDTWMTRMRHTIPLGLAAAVMVIVAVSTFYFTGRRPDTTTSVATNSFTGRVYETSIGQRASIVLVDGSMVTLAPQSRLVLARQYGTSTRAVQLTGEAYFTVTPSTTAPFVVHTGAVTTRVLGTVFDVRAYTPHEPVRVVVTSGRVATSIGTRVAPLSAGMVASIGDSMISTSVAKDPNAYTGWTDGRLVFDHTPVPEMLVTLSRWYGYQFQLTDSALARQHVNAEFTVTSAASMIAIVGELLNVNVTLRNNVVTLHPRTARNRARPPARSRDRSTYSLPTEVGK